MQNRYVGDIGDFGKFGLLRNLVGSQDWKLGVVWYLFTEENHNDDGRFIKYLGKSKFSKCDFDLHSKLEKIVSTERSISALEKAGILSPNTVYYSETVDFYQQFPGQTKINKEKRLRCREKWLNEALKKVQKCNAVFLDPDNGLEINSCQKLTQKRSGKYAYFNEIKKLFKGKDICIIYHHLNRHKNHGTHTDQISNRAVSLRQKINPTGKIFAIRYNHSPRAYFILSSKSVESDVQQHIKTFLKSNWANHWDNYYEEP